VQHQRSQRHANEGEQLCGIGQHGLIIPDYSRCVRVDLEKAYFIGILLEVVVSTGHPRREIDQFANLPPRPENRLSRETRRLSS
jgi:hypothetical protein